MFSTDFPEKDFTLEELGLFASLGILCALITRLMLALMVFFSDWKKSYQRSFPSVFATCLMVAVVTALSAGVQITLGGVFMEIGHSIVKDLVRARLTHRKGVSSKCVWNECIVLNHGF